MTQEELVNVIAFIRDSASWRVEGPTLDDVVWLDEVYSKPTQAEIDAGAVELAWYEVRRRRNGLLLESDWTHTTDAPLSETEKTAWFNYRQTLRDIPQDFATPEDVVWPEKP